LLHYAIPFKYVIANLQEDKNSDLTTLNIMGGKSETFQFGGFL